MGKISLQRPRGLMLPPRADTGDAVKVLAELQKTMAEFKATNDKRLADLEKGREDYVQNEQVEKINANVGELTTELDRINATMAALKLGAGDNEDPALASARRDHAQAFNQFFRRGVEADLRDLEVKAALSTSSDPDGGYTVTPQIETTIDRVLGTVSAMRGIARVMPLGAASYRKLINKGGGAGGWVGEKDSRPETTAATLSILEFPAMELYAMPAATQGLLDDSGVDIAAWLADEVAITFAEMEGAAFISGDGVGKPRGLLNYTTVADASYAWGKIGYKASGVAAALSDATHNGVDVLIDAQYALKQGYRSNARWLMNRQTAGVVRKLKDENGNYLWQPPVVAGQPATLLGHPVTDDDNMPNIGAGNLPIAFGDFQRGYLIVDRLGIRVLRDPYSAKPYVLFYTTKRVGGGVQNFEAIKLVKIAAS